jgi:aminoglycoside phosphotransferase family enzyme/predicted kinase
MELARLITTLTDPAAYPDPVDVVEVHQTHISVIFLADRHAYKIKKPLVCGFLDYGSLERRRQSCEEEVRVNRRLAPTVYLGVVPITREGLGVRIEGGGEVVEWAVKMERLPEEATLRNRLRRGLIGVPQVEALARRIAEFHARADAAPSIAACGRFAVVSGNALANFEESAAHVETTVSRPVFERLRAFTDRSLAGLRPVIEGRAGRGVPRDGHGDLRLDHVYLFPDRPPEAELVIIDGIEFNERFRFGDPVADLAFLVMDFIFQGRRDLAKTLADAYFQASGDEEGWILLPFYVTYRAAVRGKVEGMELTEPEIPQADRDAALVRARAHWLLALGESEEDARRPCLLLVGGLPGSGKSTLARGLAERAGFSVIRSDRVRKELAGLALGATAASPFESGIYTPEWTARTYAECLRRAEALLFQGGRVLVDASFGAEAHRRLFLEAAERWCVPACLLHCRTEVDETRARLQGRRGDDSDADWSTYRQAAERWEEPSPLTLPVTESIPTTRSPEESLSRALLILRTLGLFGPEEAPART